MKKVLLFLILFLGLIATPQSRQVTADPLIGAADFSYLGQFTIPNPDWNTESALDYGGYGMGICGTDTLCYGGHDWYDRLARISIPAIGGQATIVEAAVDPFGGNRTDIDPGDAGAQNVGGSMVWNGRLIVTAYVYYDADNDAVASHFARSVATVNGGTVTGPVRVSATMPVAATGGYMLPTPAGWTELVGGPALTGNCCLSIIGRTSAGPALAAFDPDQIGVTNPVAASTLLHYPLATPLRPETSSNDTYNLTTEIKAVAWRTGTRTVAFIGKQGTGPYCYGTGTSDPGLDGQPVGDGSIYCYDPASAVKGTHAYPYRLQAWLYDANDLVAVRNATAQSYEPQPYAVVPLPSSDTVCGNNCGITGAAFDPSTNRIYVSRGGGSMVVNVWEITGATGGGAPPAVGAPRTVPRIFRPRRPGGEE